MKQNRILVTQQTFMSTRFLNQIVSFKYTAYK